jgi:hypothetical protein
MRIHYFLLSRHVFSAWFGWFRSFSARKTRFLSIFSFKLHSLVRKCCCRSVCGTGTYFTYMFVRVGSVFSRWIQIRSFLSISKIVFASGTRHGSLLTKIITSLPYYLSYHRTGYDRNIVFLSILIQSMISFRDKVQYSSQFLFLYTSLFLVPSSFYDFYILCCGSGYRFGNRIWVQEVQYRYGHRKRAQMFSLEGWRLLLRLEGPQQGLRKKL